MSIKVKIGNGNCITLNDKNYLASGGQGVVYKSGNSVFKIYHNKLQSLPQKKINELSVITNPNVIIPKEIIYDVSNGDVIGYTTDFVNGADPLLKYFTKTYKQDNNISPEMIAELVKKMQLITKDIHSKNILITDYNELNVLIKNSNELIPFYIDTDSYQTPSFKSLAVMNSIMDRRCSKIVNGHLIYNPDALSDWFSWAVLTFQLYTNIHPYRGGHPNYKPRDKVKQMDDGISVFHTGVRVPPSVNDFNVIPPRHRAWYEDVFLKGNRSVPPLPDSLAPLAVPATIITIKGNKGVDVIQVAAYSENVVYVSQIMGMNYVITKKKIYSDDRELAKDCEKVKKTLVCPASDGTLVVAKLLGNKVIFTELHRQREVGTISTVDMFERNGSIYTVSGGKLIENNFPTFGDKIIHRVNEVENISVYSATMFDGCIIQDLLGKKMLILPYKKGACFTKYLPHLDGYRVVGAKAERNVVVVIAEKNGQYDRFIVVFKKDYSDFDVRKVEDVIYDTINFTVMESGLCLLLSNPDELEMFGNNQNIQVLDNPPIDATMKLFNTPDGVFFINGNTIHQMKRK